MNLSKIFYLVQNILCNHYKSVKVRFIARVMCRCIALVSVKILHLWVSMYCTCECRCFTWAPKRLIKKFIDFPMTWGSLTAYLKAYDCPIHYIDHGMIYCIGVRTLNWLQLSLSVPDNWFFLFYSLQRLKPRKHKQDELWSLKCIYRKTKTMIVSRCNGYRLFWSIEFTLEYCPILHFGVLC